MGPKEFHAAYLIKKKITPSSGISKKNTKRKIGPNIGEQLLF